jgi:hypothetical protein
MKTYREKFYEKYNIPLDKSLSLEEIAEVADVPLAALKEVYRKGEGAWYSSLGSVRLKGSFAKNPNTKAFPRSARLPMSQWSFARVYSFLMKGPTYYGPDNYIAKKYKI